MPRLTASTCPMGRGLPRRTAYRLPGSVSVNGLPPPKALAGRTSSPACGEHLAGLASIADQSDGRVVLRLRGDRVRDVLAKGVPVDLHPRSFKTGDVASTLVAYIGVQIQQLDDRPTFQLMAFRSLAGSLWSWLTKSAAEFGAEFVRRPS